MIFNNMFKILFKMKINNLSIYLVDNLNFCKHIHKYPKKFNNLLSYNFLPKQSIDNIIKTDTVKLVNIN